LHPANGANATVCASDQPNRAPRWAGPVGEAELEPRIRQTLRYHAAALQNQFCFRAQEKGANLQHPFCCGKADARSPGLTKHAHELMVRQRAGRGHVDTTIQGFMRNQEFNGTDEVRIMHP